MLDIRFKQSNSSGQGAQRTINFIPLVLVIEELFLIIRFFVDDERYLRPQRHWNIFPVHDVLELVGLPSLGVVCVAFGDQDVGFAHLVEVRVFLVD
jgi:hypothetical protein